MTSSILTSIAPLNVLAQDNQQGGSILSLLIILIPVGAILYMTVIPQRKQRQRHADMLRRIDVGDEVLTNGGIVGVITHIDDDVYHLEIDTDVVVRVAKSAIARSMAEPDPAERPAGRQRKGLFGAAGASDDGDDSTSEK